MATLKAKSRFFSQCVYQTSFRFPHSVAHYGGSDSMPHMSCAVDVIELCLARMRAVSDVV